MQRYQHLHMSNITGKLGVFDDLNSHDTTSSIYEQTIPSNQWTIEHSMGSNAFFINIFKNNNGVREKIELIQKVELTAPDILTLYFSEELVGYVEL